jgi:hypothetical protein
MKIDNTIGLTDFFVMVYVFIRKHFILLALSTVLGLGLGIGYATYKTKYYYSELSGYSIVTPKANLLEILSPLTSLTDEKNYLELSRLLEITEEQASSLRQLEFTSSRHVKTTTNPKVNDELFGEIILVKVETYNQAFLPQIEQGLKNYLGNNAYVQQQVKLKTMANQQIIHSFYDNLDQVDSLRTAPNQGAISITNLRDPKHFAEAVEYVENLKAETQTLEAFTIVSSFYNLQKPANKNLLISAAATVVFMLLGLFLALFKEVAQLSKTK